MRKLRRTRENPPRKAETSGAAWLGAARGSPRTKHSLLPFPVTTPLWTRPVGSIPEIYYHPPDHRVGQYLTLLRVRPGMCWCRILQPRGGGARGEGNRPVDEQTRGDPAAPKVTGQVRISTPGLGQGLGRCLEHARGPVLQQGSRGRGRGREEKGHRGASRAHTRPGKG